jgi:thymidylate synthase
MKSYLLLMKQILAYGKDHPDRTGVGRRSVFGKELRFDLRDGFPLVTTRKIFTRGLIVEDLWFLSGSKDATILQKQGVKIWDKWTPTQEDAEKFLASKNYHRFTAGTEADVYSRVGTIGPMYGNVWRGNDKPNSPDQIARLLEGLRNKPFDSRHCVTAWIPEHLPYSNLLPKENVLSGKGALAPCHCWSALQYRSIRIVVDYLC